MAAVLTSSRVLWGASAPGISLSGLTQNEAKTKIAEHFQDFIEPNPIIYILCPGKRYTIFPADIDLGIDAEKMALESVQIGRSGSIFKKFSEQITALLKGFEKPYIFHYDDKKLANILTAIYNEHLLEAKSAYCSLANGAVQLHPESLGKKPDLEKLLKDCAQEKLSAQIPLTVELSIDIQSPEINESDLTGINALLAEYRSNFNASNLNRSENIRIAAESLNHLLLSPAKTASFNERVGLRVAEAGFKEAPVLIDGKSVPDIGGGVCQVSSTLYNAILLADLKPVSRSPHFHPLGYVPIGFDATVADQLIDFKFENSLSHSVYILTSIANGELTISILGNSADKNAAEIALTSTIDRVIAPSTIRLPDPTLAAGTQKTEEGLEGYIVSSYRIKSQNGQEIDRELLYVDTYSPEDKIIRVGTKLRGGL